jgi:ribosomal-protein-alanine N-acetyltransferase
MDWTRSTNITTVRGLIDQWLARHASGEEYTWVLTHKHIDTPIGGLGCRLRDHALDFGYVLQRESWGRGFATEAATAIVSWAFTLPQVYRVWATCDAENLASARVLEKAGLSREGVLRRYAVRPQIGPEPRDAWVYAKVR